MAKPSNRKASSLVDALTALRDGDFSVRLPTTGNDREVAALFNEIAALNGRTCAELEKLATTVGKEGKITKRAEIEGARGDWRLSIASVNTLIDDITQPIAEVGRVIDAVSQGDLSQSMVLRIDRRDLKGEFHRIGNMVNAMVRQLATFASEVTRVAREVGTEGNLGGQANVKGVAGTWKDLTDNVNAMATNLTSQVRNIAEVTTAVASGDLSKKITVEVKGEIAELKDTINTMVDQLNGFASEVTRVAREVGTEGKLGGQAQVPGVGGTWKDLTDNVNMMADNLTSQVRNIAEVTTAVARGDLSKKITVDVKGEIAELKSTINTMVDQLNGFASEVTRVAREVGTEGKLGGQAEVPGVGGTWKDLTDNVNLMADKLTGQVRNIAEVTTAVARGDLSKKITVDVKGEIAELKDTINTMVDQLNGFASEVTRVAREVGTEGKLGGQAQVPGVGGTWKDLTDNVNLMADNLTGQVRNIAEVTTAVARGDLSKKITVDVKGEIAELKGTINTMVDQLNSFASEVTRVAREVGSEGKLGGQAKVEGVAGTWADLTDNVNELAANLTGQVRNIAEVTTAVASGDLSKKITVDVKGEILELKNTVNTMVDQLNSFASEVTRVAREVGTEGKLGGQANVKGVAGTWADLTDNVNLMADNLTGQVRNIAEVTTAVARGDLSKKITVDVKGEIAELKGTINTMVDQLNSFASEVTRVAREVGTEGKLGGQAQVPGVGGTWKDLTDNVNLMGNNLTNQVRGIAEVVTAVAQGNLKRKLAVEAKGEIAALAETINFMIDTLSTFGDQVTNMAREVGIEGKLGGQARVPGAAGLWRDLTDNVNQLAANLTNQVRSIAEVATAVTKGDLTQSIAVEASGEMAALKDNINEMIRNLKDQTLKNAEQDWLKTNLARFSRMLQGERDLATVSNLIMTELAPLVDAQYGVFYVARPDGDETVLELAASYGTEDREKLRPRFRLREGLIGQCAADKRATTLEKVPNNFMRIDTGLGQSAPSNVIIMPALFEDEVKAVLELATFGGFNEAHRSFLTQLMESVGIVLNTIAATMWTEGLLKQSQMLTEELQSRQTELTTKQDELHRTNAELQEKAELLEKEKKQVEAKNIEIEMARHAVEEKAEQLALTSKYKSEFLANMSHELRTPLNSLLILSKLLSENPAGNLNEKQTEFARTIHSAGTDLLNLINDILDLSKIESGTVSINLEDMELADLKLHVERTFRQIAKDKQLTFAVRFADDLPASIRTDEKRLQQIILNLLSNAFKFTAEGEVTLSVRCAKSGWSEDNGALAEAEKVVEFAVSDTGIGIPQDKLRLIFEAFQQADGTTSRKYGGTGLGLSISREIARLLGGELQVSSQPGDGSVFTLYIPLHKAGLKQIAARPHAGHPAEEMARLLPDDRDELAGNRWVLVIGGSDVATRQFIDLAHEAGLRAVHFDRGSGVMAFMRRNHPDAVLLDPDLTDISGLVLLDLIKNDPQTASTPVYLTSVAADGEDPAVLGAEKAILSASDRGATGKAFKQIKSRAARKRNAPSKAAKPTASLTGKCVLIIDDDVRNIFSLTSALEASGVDAAYAESGADGLAALGKNDAIDAVLVDIMMPDMDGYETIKRIRALPGGDALPIIAVTAKAMAGDRQKCLDAGADDYIAKPVDIDLLNALLRVWVLAIPRDQRVRDAAQ